MKILNHYEKEGFNVIEYTKDGKTASHIVRVPIQTQSIVQPSIEEQILAENQYQTMLSELTTLGGM